MTQSPPGLVVASAGPALLVQDLGRPGWAHLGVPRSGALDQRALRLANRLVGNAEDAAGLEIVLGGVRLIAERSLRIALTGAHLRLSVAGRAQPWGQAVSVRAGEVLEISPAAGGLRSWLAISGGVLGELVLGSVSTDTLTGLGPPPVRDGDRLTIGASPGQGTEVSAEAVPLRAELGVAVLRVALGPRDDWFTPESLARLTETEYAVSPASNRVGIRLDGPEGSQLERLESAELPSEGIVAGAVQVPSGGMPLVFLADHPVTGGYPVIAVVDEAGLARCAQLRPGDRVRFALS